MVNVTITRNTPQQSGSTGDGTSKSNDTDASGRRVRLRPKPAAMGQILGTGPLLRPLYSTNGMVWPYQPDIQYSQDVEYQPIQMVHTNQEFHAYTRTPAVKLTCSGEFTVQNQTEGLYALGCLHFLRTVTKMYFGQSSNPGTPPPVLLFDAYGKYMFNKLPVIVTQFSSNMPKDIDYVPVNLNNLGKALEVVNGVQNNLVTGLFGNYATNYSSEGYIWLPAVFTISVSLIVQNTPSKLRSFNLDSFRDGSSLKNEGGWI